MIKNFLKITPKDLTTAILFQLILYIAIIIDPTGSICLIIRLTRIGYNMHKLKTQQLNKKLTLQDKVSLLFSISLTSLTAK